MASHLSTMSVLPLPALLFFSECFEARSPDSGKSQAALSSSYDNVNLLLQHEAHVNTFDKINGSSPLHDACYSGSLKYLCFRFMPS